MESEQPADRDGQTAWRLGVSVREYRAIEAGQRSPSFEVQAAPLGTRIASP